MKEKKNGEGSDPSGKDVKISNADITSVLNDLNKFIEADQSRKESSDAGFRGESVGSNNHEIFETDESEEEEDEKK
jgi:hypothetical protein